MKVQTFPHDVVKELHDGDPAVRVAVQQLGVHSSCEEFSEGGDIFTFHNVIVFKLTDRPPSASS